MSGSPFPGGTGELLGQDFEGDVTAEADVFGAINDAHTTAAELIEDAVMGERLADHPWEKDSRPEYIWGRKVR
jgi:hypothetical protein